MRYHNIAREAIRPITWVRRAIKQAKSSAVLADEQAIGLQRQALLMAGRQGRDKVPLVLGDASTVANIVGSVLCRTQGQQLIGVIGFASDVQAQQTRERYLAGELVLSLITNPIAGVELQRGESFHSVDGPALVLTQWEPMQVILDVA